jgi:tight adherence protein B
MLLDFLPYIAAMFASVAALAFLFGLRRILRRDQQVDSRLSAYLTAPTEGLNVSDESLESAFADRINEAIKRQSFAERISLDLTQADVPLTVPEYLLMRVAVPLVLVVVGLVVWRSILIVPFFLAIGFVAPIIWLRIRRSRRNGAFNDQLAESLSLVAASMRGGFSLLQSFANVARDAPQPTKHELQRVGQEVQLGLSLTQALDNLALRMESEDLDLVVTAIKIHARVGGNLTAILDTISTTIRERARLRRDVRVITSMGRISSLVIGLLPVALALIIFAINPRYMMQLFTPGLTLCIPVGAVFFWILGFVVIRKIVDVKV